MTATLATPELQVLGLEQVRESKNNPRKTFDDAAMKELIASVAEKGVLVPILVRPVNEHFEIICGARRYRAAKAAKVERIPALVHQMSEEQALEVAVIENLQRADVHPLEEADGYRALLATKRYTVESLAQRIGVSIRYIYAKLELAKLTAPAKKVLEEGGITEGHATLIARLDPQSQKAALDVCNTTDGWGRDCKSYTIGVRDLSSWIAREIHLDLNGAPWKKDDTMLFIKAGPCSTCPKMAGNSPHLYPDAKHPRICMDRACFQEKMSRWIDLEKATLEKKGHKVKLITHRYSNSKHLLGTSGWNQLQRGAKHCEKTMKGIMAEGSAIGRILDICIGQDCRQPGHGRVSVSTRRAGGSASRSNESERERIKREEARRQAELLKQRITTRTRELLLRAVIKKTSKISRADLELVASAQDGLPYPADLGDLFPSMGQFENTFGRHDAFLGKVVKVSDQELAKYLVACSLGDELGTWGKAPRLYATAKRLKVDIATIEKVAKIEKMNEKLHKEQAQKWKNRVASKAARYDEPTCAACGCTEKKACPGGCSWTKLDKKTNKGLCSACEAPKQ